MNNNQEMKFLSLLAKEYPTIQSASAEIINLRAILNLPKGTEHFMSDIHGEHEAFLHILNNASGVIKEKIDRVYGNALGDHDRRALAALIYYPEHKLDEAKETHGDLEDWQRVTLHRLIEVCRSVTSKYTRSKVRKALPRDFEYIIDELLHTNYEEHNKEQYYENIITAIIDTQRAEAFIVAIANLIKRMAVDRLHIVGDIFDRGAHADVILDKLVNHHSVDIEWGNHDVLWMGAAAGSRALVATVVKNCMQYDNLDMIENAYGINLLPLAVFATDNYEESPIFTPKYFANANYKPRDVSMYSKMHKAISIIQFKLEGQIIERRPEYKMADRDMLSRVDYDTMTIEINGVRHPLKDKVFPTINPENPNELTPAEEELMDQLTDAFQNSEKLQSHMRFLYTAGSLYCRFNGNVLFHGCMPCEDDGSFMEMTFDNQRFSGKDLFDYADLMARQGYYAIDGSEERIKGQDFLWFLWCGRNSPVFGRRQMTTFERVLVEDKDTWVEPKNAYYAHYQSEDFCKKVLREFGATSDSSRIVNGHIPVKVKEGEGPLKANGKLVVIDGGFCKAYQKQTGIAGYTMFFSSHGIRISAHEPFESMQSAMMYDQDIRSNTVIVENLPDRFLVSQTDAGATISEKIADLQRLLEAYRTGIIKESR